MRRCSLARRFMVWIIRMVDWGCGCERGECRAGFDCCECGVGGVGCEEGGVKRRRKGKERM
jgi:hypothetical protein